MTGEKIVLRLFSNAAALTLGELGFPDEARVELERFLRQTAGLLLLTGPAGSGKTTTIYACLRHLAASSGRHIITVEDPVEQIIPGIMQTEVAEARGLTFGKAARHLLRQDPQVLVLGEIRDDETADIAVRAALTGHLVISTLHAGSCKGVFDRLLVMCPDRHAVMSVVEMVVNQRLVRRLCAGCRGVGCAACLHTGYKGCVPLVEWLRPQGAATLTPARSLEIGARDLVQSGVTNDAEIRRVLGL